MEAKVPKIIIFALWKYAKEFLYALLLGLVFIYTFGFFGFFFLAESYTKIEDSATINYCSSILECWFTGLY